MIALPLEVDELTDEEGFDDTETLDPSVRDTLQKWGIFDKHLSIDEMMIRYYGHHYFKQYVKGKPIRRKTILGPFVTIELPPLETGQLQACQRL
ncbi:hypothetical protein TNCV_4349751 [Trichonephila clavipes]|nr:hypothetical protein TNCV_4349751 [Trichonephila clavipes]